MIEPAFYDRIGQNMLGIVEMVRVGLGARGFTPKRVVHLVPGIAAAWDEACDGLLYGRVESIQYLDGVRSASGEVCVQSARVRFAVGLIRCIAVVNDRGVAPKPNAITLDGLRMTENAETMREVLSMVSGLREMTWRPLGAEGGNAGGEWLGAFEIEVCDARADIIAAVQNMLSEHTDERESESEHGTTD